MNSRRPRQLAALVALGSHQVAQADVAHLSKQIELALDASNPGGQLLVQSHPCVDATLLETTTLLGASNRPTSASERHPRYSPGGNRCRNQPLRGLDDRAANLTPPGLERAPGLPFGSSGHARTFIAEDSRVAPKKSSPVHTDAGAPKSVTDMSLDIEGTSKAWIESMNFRSLARK
jgi:hypothetical protein